MSTNTMPRGRVAKFYQSPIHNNPIDFLIAEAQAEFGQPLPINCKYRLRATYQLWHEVYQRTQHDFFKKFTQLEKIKFNGIGGANGVSN